MNHVELNRAFAKKMLLAANGGRVSEEDLQDDSTTKDKPVEININAGGTGYAPTAGGNGLENPQASPQQATVPQPVSPAPAAQSLANGVTYNPDMQAFGRSPIQTGVRSPQMPSDASGQATQVNPQAAGEPGSQGVSGPSSDVLRQYDENQKKMLENQEKIDAFEAPMIAKRAIDKATHDSAYAASVEKLNQDAVGDTEKLQSSVDQTTQAINEASKAGIDREAYWKHGLFGTSETANKIFSGIGVIAAGLIFGAAGLNAALNHIDNGINADIMAQEKEFDQKIKAGDMAQNALANYYKVLGNKQAAMLALRDAQNNKTEADFNLAIAQEPDPVKKARLEQARLQFQNEKCIPGRLKLMETLNSMAKDRVTTQATLSNIAETKRHNQAMEGIQQGRVDALAGRTAKRPAVVTRMLAEQDAAIGDLDAISKDLVKNGGLSIGGAIANLGGHGPYTKTADIQNKINLAFVKFQKAYTGSVAGEMNPYLRNVVEANKPEPTDTLQTSLKKLSNLRNLLLENRKTLEARSAEAGGGFSRTDSEDRDLDFREE